MSKAKINVSYREKLIYEGGIYHITQRAPGGEKLFLEENDYLTLIYLVKKYAKIFDLDIFCFCFMPNHIHLLLRINKANLSEAMKSLFTSYAMRFNEKYKRKGHVFCGVYRASPCLDDAHLITASLYIHLNPQKAKVIEDARTYKWSSIGVYINSCINSFLKRDFILGIIYEDLDKAILLYNKMFENYSSIACEDIADNPDAVINLAKLGIDNLSKILDHRKIKKDFIISEKNTDTMIEKFKNRKQWSLVLLKEKEELIDLIRQLKKKSFTLSKISETLNISRTTLYKLLTNKVEP